MDERIMKDFLVRAGRSYYHSPEFERERLTFQKVKADFEPCARFGIGFMSLFMLGDQISIHTRRYRGSSTGIGEPLIVEINSIGGLIVLRRGPDDQPAGTSVVLVGRRKPERFSTATDRVHLTDTLYAYDVAGEFPVSGICKIPEIADEVSISVEMAKPWHPFVKHDVKNCAMFSQDFSEIDSRLRGEVTCGVPLTATGELAACTPEGGWIPGQLPHGHGFWVAGEEKFQVYLWEGRTCIDGILVAGPHGRGYRGHILSGTMYRNPISFGQDLFVLDVRGDLKPDLNPDRSPPSKRGSVLDDEGPSWRRLNRIAGRAHVRLWEKVVSQFSTKKDANALWQLMALHRAQISSMLRGFVWDMIWVPSLKCGSTELFFRRFGELCPVPFHSESPLPFAAEVDGTRIALSEEMASWDAGKPDGIVSSSLRQAVISMATLTLRDGVPTLEFSAPKNSAELGFTSIMFDRWAKRIPTMSFGPGFEGVLAVHASNRVLNRQHPIIDYLLLNQEIVLE